MARLKTKDLERNKESIDDAALACFSTSGFHGITMRDIAEKANLPLGSLYNYYDDKTALFQACITRQSAAFLSPENEVIRYFLKSKFPDDLPLLAEAIRLSIKTYEAYFKLMYVDVVEFEGRHIREVFSNLDHKFQKALKNRFDEIGLLGPKKNIEPSFALVGIYLAFYQYFILSKLFGATNIYGKRNDNQVVTDLLELFFHGIRRGAN